MTDQTACVYIRDGVMAIALDRPGRVNAFTRAMIQEMVAALDQAGDDGRAVIVAGAGRAFCAGADHPMMADRIDSRTVAARNATADNAEFPDRVSADMPGFFPWWEEPPWA